MDKSDKAREDKLHKTKEALEMQEGVGDKKTVP